MLNAEAITVGLVAPFPPPAGGMAVQAQRLAAGLREDGARVLRVPVNPRWPVVLRPLRRLRGFRTGVTAALFLLRLVAAARRVDLFHVLACSYMAHYLFTIPTICVARLFRVAVIVNYRGGDARAFFTRRPRALRWLTRADRLSVPSGFLEDVFRDFGLRATVVPNIAEVDRFRFSARDALVPHLLVTRHLEPWYNISLAVRAFERVRAARPEATLTIAGDGSRRAVLERLVAERRIEGVAFLGAVPSECMPEVYDRCDVALNPTTVDNMPISVLEAFAAGLVVVSTAVGGVPYLVADGETGYLVPPDDCAAMAERIVWLCDHPDEARATAARARRQCEAYTWPAVRRRLWAVYRKAIRGSAKCNV